MNRYESAGYKRALEDVKRLVCSERAKNTDTNASYLAALDWVEAALSPLTLQLVNDSTPNFTDASWAFPAGNIQLVAAIPNEDGQMAVLRLDSKNLKTTRRERMLILSLLDIAEANLKDEEDGLSGLQG